MLKGVNDVFREIEHFEECSLFRRMDDLTQREDKWIDGLILGVTIHKHDDDIETKCR